MTKRQGRILMECSGEEFEGLYAALVAMVLEIQGVQDNLPPEVCVAADDLLKEMDQFREELT